MVSFPLFQRSGIPIRRDTRSGLSLPMATYPAQKTYIFKAGIKLPSLTIYHNVVYFGYVLRKATELFLIKLILCFL